MQTLFFHHTYRLTLFLSCLQNHDRTPFHYVCSPCTICHIDWSCWGKVNKVHVTETSSVSISCRFSSLLVLQAELKWSTHTPCPHNFLVWPFWINKDPGISCKCVQTTCCVCASACIYVDRVCNSAQRKEGSHKMMGISKLSYSWWGSLPLYAVCSLLSRLYFFMLFLASSSEQGFDKQHFLHTVAICATHASGRDSMSCKDCRVF